MDANTAAPSVRQQCSVNTVCLAESSMTVNESFASFVLFVAHMKIRSAPHSVMVYFQHRSRRAKHQWRKEKTVCSSTRQLVECTKSKWNARKESFVTPVSAKRRDMMTADTEAEKVLWWDKTCRAKWNNRKHGCNRWWQHTFICSVYRRCFTFTALTLLGEITPPVAGHCCFCSVMLISRRLCRRLRAWV